VIELTSDSEESPIKMLELAAGVLIRKAALVHFREVVCSGQCLMDSREVGGDGMTGMEGISRRCGGAASWQARWNLRCLGPIG